MEQTQNTCRVAIKFRFAVGSYAGNNYSSWGTLKIVTEIEPTICFICQRMVKNII